MKDEPRFEILGFENMTPEELEQFKKEYEWFQKASAERIAERIAEIEKKALERLRNSPRESLRDYIEE